MRGRHSVAVVITFWCSVLIAVAGASAWVLGVVEVAGALTVLLMLVGILVLLDGRTRFAVLARVARRIEGVQEEQAASLRDSYLLLSAVSDRADVLTGAVRRVESSLAAGTRSHERVEVALGRLEHAQQRIEASVAHVDTAQDIVGATVERVEIAYQRIEESVRAAHGTLGAIENSLERAHRTSERVEVALDGLGKEIAVAREASDARHGALVGSLETATDLSRARWTQTVRLFGLQHERQEGLAAFNRSLAAALDSARSDCGRQLSDLHGAVAELGGIIAAAIEDLGQVESANQARSGDVRAALAELREQVAHHADVAGRSAGMGQETRSAVARLEDAVRAVGADVEMVASSSQRTVELADASLTRLAPLEDTAEALLAEHRAVVARLEDGFGHLASHLASLSDEQAEIRQAAHGVEALRAAHERWAREVSISLTELESRLSREADAASGRAEASRETGSAVSRLEVEVRAVRGVVDAIASTTERTGGVADASLDRLAPVEGGVETLVAGHRAIMGRLQHGFMDLARDVEALLQLQKRVEPRSALPPSGGFAMDARDLVQLLSLVDAIAPKRILELGSGTSTVWLAYQRAGSSEIVSIDHLENYAEATRTWLRRHRLSDAVDVRIAPLVDVELGGERQRWYSPSVFDDLSDIDLVLVDGPPESTGPQARYPALPALVSRLAPVAHVVLDDAFRPDESKAVQRWLSEIPGLTRLVSPSPSLAVLEYRRTP